MEPTTKPLAALHWCQEIDKRARGGKDQYWSIKALECLFAESLLRTEKSVTMSGEWALPCRDASVHWVVGLDLNADFRADADTPRWIYAAARGPTAPGPRSAVHFRAWHQVKARVANACVGFWKIGCGEKMPTIRFQVYPNSRPTKGSAVQFVDPQYFRLPPDEQIAWVDTHGWDPEDVRRVVMSIDANVNLRKKEVYNLISRKLRAHQGRQRALGAGRKQLFSRMAEALDAHDRWQSEQAKPFKDRLSQKGLGVNEHHTENLLALAGRMIDAAKRGPANWCEQFHPMKEVSQF